MMSKYVFDLDHTLCNPPYNEEEKRWMYEAEPFRDRIETVNKLWEEGITLSSKLQEDVILKSITMKERLINFVHGDSSSTLRTGVKFASYLLHNDKQSIVRTSLMEASIKS